MLSRIIFTVALVITSFVQGQNSKLIESTRLIENKKIEILEYRFFNNETVVVDINNKNWKAETKVLHPNGTCEIIEEVWIDAGDNIVSSVKQYYTSHNYDKKSYQGKIYNEFSYVNGIKNGVENFYYTNGQLKKTGLITPKGRQGEWKTYYANGNVKSIENWVGFKREGKAVFYFENGNICSEGNFKNGEVTGKWNFYEENEKEKLIASETYALNDFTQNSQTL